MAENIWDQELVHRTVEEQKNFFASGTTLDISWRIRQLKMLREAVRSHEAQMVRALNEDLGRHPTEGYFCDVGTVIMEIDEETCTITAFCTAVTDGKTGVEMEALTGVSVALLTIYDMCKAIDKRMVIRDIHLVQKKGGKSGDFTF